jgi:coniferyl-aldehyde dehydrogenase
MSDADAKQIERLKSLLASQKASFRKERHRDIARRREDMDRVANMCRENVDAIADAISQDFGNRARQESVIAEIAFIVQDVAHTKKHLSKWMAQKSIPVPLTLQPGKAYVRHEPVGVVGIISPWNYPFQLAMAPLVAALAAGCRAIIKPSEYTPATAELMKTLIAQNFEEDHVTVVTGGAPVGEAFCSLKFDHLFYTGSTQVGRLVALAAAENLVPTTLELGGKSPAILTAEYPIEAASKSLGWGKFYNSGQTCVAPDYLMVPNGKERAIAEAIISVAQHQYPDAGTDDAFTSIVSDRHYERLNAMIEEARSGGAEILQPEHDAKAARAGRKIPPTVILNPPEDSKVMTEEIFGPILPVIGYSELDAATNYICDRPHPLALYVYSTDKKQARRLLDATQSGGAGVNINIVHLSVPDLPFGGVGASGQGSYHGERGFQTFTHERSVLETGKWHPSRLLAPPYGKVYESVAKKQLK